MTDKFTPGPWTVGSRTAQYHDADDIFPPFKALSVGTDKRQVAIIPLDESNAANAHLIAAAPALMQSLERLLDMIVGWEMSEDDETGETLEDIVDAYRAIALARGEAPNEQQ